MDIDKDKPKLKFYESFSYKSYIINNIYCMNLQKIN